METDAGTFSAFLQNSTIAVESWIASVNSDTLIWTLISVSALFVLRKRISKWGVSVVQALLKRFSVVLSDEVVSQVKAAAEILVATFALFVGSEILFPNGVAKLFFNQLLGSVAIVAIFGAWYRLSGPFASLLRSEKTNSVSVEKDWIQRITQFAILLFGLTSLLRVWHVDISGALAGVGVLGAGLAIATQDLIRNLVAGMTNISEKRFETGDAIEVQGQFVGTVKRIDLRSTMVVGFDQIPRHIPNSDLSNSVVLNYSSRTHRRVMLKVPLVLSSTQEQIEAVRDGLREYHQTCGDFSLEDDAPKYIYVSDLGPSSVDILIYAWTKGADYDQFLQATERLTLAILSATRRAGTKLAYPTQTLKMDASSMHASPEAADMNPAS